jgi:hypothetical protein
MQKKCGLLKPACAMGDDDTRQVWSIAEYRVDALRKLEPIIGCDRWTRHVRKLLTFDGGIALHIGNRGDDLVRGFLHLIGTERSRFRLFAGNSAARRNHEYLWNARRALR